MRNDLAAPHCAARERAAGPGHEQRHGSRRIGIAGRNLLEGAAVLRTGITLDGLVLDTFGQVGNQTGPKRDIVRAAGRVAAEQDALGPVQNLHVLQVEDGDRDRHVLKALFNAPGRDDDVIESAGAIGGLGGKDWMGNGRKRRSR